MKKRLAILVGALFASLLMAMAFSTIKTSMALETPIISLDTVTAYPGETVTVKVSLANNPGLYAYTLGIDYDETRLSLKSVAKSSEVGGTFAYAEKAVWFHDAFSDMYADGTIMELTFDVLPTAPSGDAPVTVTYGSGDISDFSEKDVEYTVQSGKVTVTDKPRFVGANINIYDELKLQFYAKIDLHPETVYMTAEDPAGVITEVKEKTLTSNGYLFYISVDPSKMADNYTVSLTDGTTVYQTITYSVRQCCNATMSVYGSNTALKTLLSNMLEYGAAAQTYRQHNLSDLANTPTWVAGSLTPFTGAENHAQRIGAGDSGAYLYGAALRLDNMVHIQFYVQSSNSDNLTFKLYRTASGSSELQFVKEAPVQNGLYLIEGDSLKYYELDDTYTGILMRDGTEIQRIVYDVESFVFSTMNNTAYPGLADMSKRLFVYGQQCKSYKK